MSEKIKISLINKTTSEKKVKKVIPSMKLNEFRETQKIEKDYVFISDDGIVDIEDEKDFEIQEILKKENNIDCIYIKIDEFLKKKEEDENKKKEEEETKRKQKEENKKKEEEENKRKEYEEIIRLEEEVKKALNEEIKLKKDHTYYLKCNKCGYSHKDPNFPKRECGEPFIYYFFVFERYLKHYISYEGSTKLGEGPEGPYSREQLIKSGCICECTRSKGIKWWSFVGKDEITIKKFS